MQNKLKSILSILAIGLFGLFALSSGGPDKNTNVTVDTGNCKEKPDIDGTRQIVIIHKDKSGTPIRFANGRLYITKQDIISPQLGNCKPIVDFDQIDFVTDVNGRWTYSLPFHANCDKDCHRLQVAIDKSLNYTGFNQVKVAFYSTSNVTFNAVSVKLTDL